MPSGRRTALSALAAAVTVGAGMLAAPAAQAAPTQVQILATNDFHGRILDNTSTGEAGAAVLAGAVEQLRAANPNTVFAAAGDLIGASTFESFIQRDKPTIDALNAAGLEVSAVGNHELDGGYDDLVGRVMAPYDASTNPLGGAEWQYVAANLTQKSTGDPAVPETWTKDFGDVRVGFVGAVTEELPSLVNPAGIADIQVDGIVSSVNEAAAGLVADGADLVVMLVHEGAPSTDCSTMRDSGVWADIVDGVSPDVDAIVSGHTHLAYNCAFPVQQWVDEGRTVKERPVVSAGQYGTNLNQLLFTVDGTTGAVSALSQAVLPLEADGNTPLYPADPEVAALVATAAKQADVEGAKTLGAITADLNRAVQPELDSAGNPTGRTVEARGAESTLGNLVADVQLWSAQQADPDTRIAFMNPGGLRANLSYAPDGVVTYREAAQVQPFANTLVGTTLTGDQIRQALEQQWQPAGASRPFLKLGISAGLEYTFDPDAAAGAHIATITLDDVPIDPAAKYRVVVNSFLAAGGDNFTALGAGENETDTGKSDLQSTVDYFAANTPVAPDLAQRSIGLRLSAPAAPTGYAPGETVAVTLSALDFTTTEPDAGTVDVAIGGTPVGSATVDPAIQRLFDTTGRATLSVTVPTGVSGTVPLQVSTPTGTSIAVPITVVVPAPTTAFGFPHRFVVRTDQTVTYTAVVFSRAGTVTGTVSMLDRGTPIASATLVESDRGVVEITLPQLSRGVHRLSVRFEGSPQFAADTGPELPIYVR